MCKYTMPGIYLDQLIEKSDAVDTVGNFDVSCIQGSVNNPLRVLAHMCMDPETGFNYEPEQIAEVVGCSKEMLEAWTLECDFDDALVYAGRLALILLGSLRNEALKYVFQDDVTEDALAAEITLGRVLKVC